MILIKGGGGREINWDYISQDISELIKKGEQIVLIHGASATRDEIAEKLGIPSKTITSPTGVSSVYTDPSAIDVFLMSYCGLVNKQIVATLQKHGVNAIGLSGIDGRLLEAKRKPVTYSVENGKTKLIKDNLTGKVEKANANLIQLLLNSGYIPVICPPAISFENEIVNTDNDLAAAVIAGSLNIKKMIVLFEAAGMLKNAEDEKSVIRTIEKEKISDFMQYAKGRMKKKLLGLQRAFDNGVEKVYFGDGRVPNPVLNAIDGNGTIIS